MKRAQACMTKTPDSLSRGFLAERQSKHIAAQVLHFWFLGSEADSAVNKSDDDVLCYSHLSPSQLASSCNTV